jgi:hypothetical protein
MAVENGSGALVRGDGVDHQLLGDGAHELVRRCQRPGLVGCLLLHLLLCLGKTGAKLAVENTIQI